VELPLTGEEVRFNGVGLAFKRMGNEASVLAPSAASVSAVNAQAAKDTELVRQEPYNKGWLMVLEPTDMKKNLKELLFGKQTVDWIRSEHQNLVEMVSEVGITFADGGQIEDVYGNIPNLSWRDSHAASCALRGDGVEPPRSFSQTPGSAHPGALHQRAPGNSFPSALKPIPYVLFSSSPPQPPTGEIFS